MIRRMISDILKTVEDDGYRITKKQVDAIRTQHTNEAVDSEIELDARCHDAFEAGRKHDLGQLGLIIMRGKINLARIHGKEADDEH